MSKRTVSQRGWDDENEIEAPARKWFKFSGQEVHETYVREGSSAAKTAEIFTDRLFKDIDLTDDATLKEKKDIQLKMSKKIAKFEKKIKTKGKQFRNDPNVMGKTFIEASDYKIFKDRSELQQSEIDSDKNENKQNRMEIQPEEENKSQLKGSFLHYPFRTLVYTAFHLLDVEQVERV